MNQHLLSTARHFFAQCVFMNSIHYKAYYRLESRQSFYRRITYVIAAISLLIIICKIIVFEAKLSIETLGAVLSVLSYVGIVLTGASLLFALFQKEDIAELKIHHRNTAEAYKELRDKYLLFIEEIISMVSSETEIRGKSEKYLEQYNMIGKNAPVTSGDDYQQAQEGLGLAGNSGEEFTWSDEEINKFLPKTLRND